MLNGTTHPNTPDPSKFKQTLDGLEGPSQIGDLFDSLNLRLEETVGVRISQQAIDAIDGNEASHKQACQDLHGVLLGLLHSPQQSPWDVLNHQLQALPGHSVVKQSLIDTMCELEDQQNNGVAMPGKLTQPLVELPVGSARGYTRVE